ncbi:IclR family transcriptional regulator [Polaromonas sp. CG_23.6]|uniref:IclR family transcriptional regulator n=1 Tax=Polaromonas sp. CG_23.6 TaxID=2760709 RepID=UPI002473E256|nr:IclR family transcriptional regulator [Polaromonas sp. CG_23.6]MDH6186736.1 DNA-binding IclR family transcriptional regulator [Polaromonas sp. CG_23.6]
MGKSVQGAQSVLRAIDLFKRIGLNHEQGLSLTGLVEMTALDRTTVYRLLSSLVQTGLVERDNRKLYRLGLEAMQLGLATMNRVPILERCRPMMIRLARRSEDTVYLVVRNGDHAHCLHHEEGAYPIKALVLKVGGLRLLGVGSAGSALLSTLTDDEIVAFHSRQRADLPQERASLAQLRRFVAQTRRAGYATTDNLVADGVSGIGVGFEVTPGTFAAISVGAIRARMGDDRRSWIAQLMIEELRASGWRPAEEESTRKICPPVAHA